MAAVTGAPGSPFTEPIAGVRRNAKTRIRRDRLAAHGGAGLPLLRLVDQHDGDSIADGIAPPAIVADDVLVVEVNRGLASGTCQNVQKLLVDHRASTAAGLWPFS